MFLSFLSEWKITAIFFSEFSWNFFLEKAPIQPPSVLESFFWAFSKNFWSTLWGNTALFKEKEIGALLNRSRYSWNNRHLPREELFYRIRISLSLLSVLEGGPKCEHGEHFGFRIHVCEVSRLNTDQWCVGSKDLVDEKGLPNTYHSRTKVTKKEKNRWLTKNNDWIFLGFGCTCRRTCCFRLHLSSLLPSSAFGLLPSWVYVGVGVGVGPESRVWDSNSTVPFDLLTTCFFSSGGASARGGCGVGAGRPAPKMKTKDATRRQLFPR